MSDSDWTIGSAVYELEVFFVKVEMAIVFRRRCICKIKAEQLIPII